MAFGGCLILVSHDRYFMDKLVEHLFVFEGEGKIRDFPGNYTDYREWADEQPAERDIAENVKASSSNNLSTSVSKTQTPAVQATKRKLSFKEQKEYDDLEKTMPAIEKKKAELTARLNEGGSYEDLAAWAKDIEGLTNQLDEMELRWLELSE